MPAPPSSRVLRFGIFEMDLLNRELRRRGIRVKLQDQPFQILSALLEHPGQIVTREDLRKTLWPGDTFVDFNNSVNAAVNRLRETLGDSAENPRFVETVPRHGYRFIAPVTENGTSGSVAIRAPGASEISLEKEAQPRAARRTFRRWLNAVLAGAVLLIAGASIWRLHRWRAQIAEEVPQIRSIVVLPLQNVSGDPSRQYFVDGIAEELTNGLAQLGSLRVVSFTSAMHYKETKKAAPEIGRDLNVDAVMEGAVIQSGQRFRISAQLIYAPTDRHLWGRNYEGDLKDISALENEISTDIARQIRASLRAQDRASFVRTQVTEPEAFDLYLHARFYSNHVNKGDTETAIKMLEKAVAIDPGFAKAYAELARAYRQEAFYFVPEDTQWQERAFVSVEKALSLDPYLAEAHVARGFLLWTHYQRFDHQGAVQEYRRALELNPNLDEAHHQLGNVLVHVGLFDKGIEELNKAIALNPSNALAQFHVGVALEYRGDYEQALTVFERIKGFANPSLWAYEKASTLFRLGRRDEAAAVVKEFLKARPEDDGGLLTSTKALIDAAANQTANALESLSAAKTANGKGFIHSHHTAYDIGATYALMNQPQTAVTWLRAAAEDGFPCYPLFEHDSNLDNLRKNPQFLSFMTEQKKQWEYFRAHM